MSTLKGSAATAFRQPRLSESFPEARGGRSLPQPQSWLSGRSCARTEAAVRLPAVRSPSLRACVLPACPAPALRPGPRPARLGPSRQSPGSQPRGAPSLLPSGGQRGLGRGPVLLGAVSSRALGREGQGLLEQLTVRGNRTLCSQGGRFPPPPPHAGQRGSRRPSGLPESRSGGAPQPWPAALGPPFHVSGDRERLCARPALAGPSSSHPTGTRPDGHR